MTQDDRPAGLVRTDLREAARVLPRIAGRAVVLGALFELLTAVLLAPLITWSFFAALRLTGEPLRTNYDLFDLLLDPRTALVVLWIPVVVAVALGGLAGAAILASSAWSARPASLLEIARGVGGSVVRLRGVALLKAFIFVAIALPVLAAVVAAVLTGAFLSAHESAIFEIVDPGASGLVAIGVIIMLCAGAAVWIAARWRFVVHVVAVEADGLEAAFVRSVETTRAETAVSLRVTLAVAVTVVGAATILTGVLGGLHAAALGLVHDANERVFIWAAALLLLFDLAALSALGSLSATWIAAVNAASWRRISGVRTDAATGETPTGRRLPNLRGALVAGVILLVLAGALTAPQVRRAINGLHRDVLITAHRGSALRAPENTLAAVRAALDDGADIVEIDVQQDADGRFVLMHDLTLERTTDRTEAVWELTTAELTAIDAGAWFSDGFRGEKIPTLKQVIEALSGQAILNVEIKLHGREHGAAQALVDLLSSTDSIESSIVTSLDQAILAEIRAIAPDLRTGLIVTASIGDIRAPDVDLLVVQPLIATPTFVARAHRRGQEVHVWSLTEPRNMHTAIDRGADGILTPDPALTRQVLDARTPEDDARALLVRLFGRSGPMTPAPSDLVSLRRAPSLARRDLAHQNCAENADNGNHADELHSAPEHLIDDDAE